MRSTGLFPAVLDASPTFPVLVRSMDDDRKERGDGAERGVDESVILDLNFVPQWARKPPVTVRYEDGARGRGRRDSGRDERRGDRRGGGRRPPREERRRDREGPPRPRRPREEAGPERGGRPPRREDEGRRESAGREFAPQARGRPPAGPRPERIPVFVRFVPDQQRLSAVVRKIRTSRRAYPIAELAGLVLVAPESYAVKFEGRRDAEPVAFYQCKLCGAAARTHEAAVEHVVSAHFGEYVSREEVTDEPPSGAFVCVGRCGLSGTLLGPPNHHSYNERIQEVHATRFGNMPLEEYRSRIEMVREPEVIEQWKEAYRQRTVYRRKTADDGAPPVLSWSEAADAIRRDIAPKQVVRCKSATMPPAVAAALNDPELRAAYDYARRREEQHPRTLLYALRAAFSHLHLYVFKAGNGEFVVSVPPAPLDPEHTVENIREVLTYLQEHPGCKRRALVADLRPDCPLDSPDVAGVLTPLSWLIEKGHVIEFFDGSLAVPRGSGGGRRPRGKRSGQRHARGRRKAAGPKEHGGTEA